MDVTFIQWTVQVFLDLLVDYETFKDADMFR